MTQPSYTLQVHYKSGRINECVETPDFEWAKVLVDELMDGKNNRIKKIVLLKTEPVLTREYVE